MSNSTSKIAGEFRSRGWVLLSEYVDSKTKLKYKCDKGHVHSVRIDHFRNGTGCPYCNNTIKKSILDIKVIVESQGYKLLSDTYKNSHTKLKICCPQGHVFFKTRVCIEKRKIK